MKLRKYQKKDYKKIAKYQITYDHVLFGAATGYGKSAIIYTLVKEVLKKNRRVLVVAPRRKLVHQLERTLDKFTPSIIMGVSGVYYKSSSLHIASTATLHNRLKKDKKYLGKLDLIIIDEVHMNFLSKSMERVKELYWNKCKWLGLSATPLDAKGYRLEGWDHTYYKHQTRKLIDMGWLSDVRVLVEDKPKGLDDVKLAGADYNEGILASFMMDDGRVSNVYKVWKKYAKNKSTMIFAVTINHANMILSDFLKHNIAAAVVHSDIEEDYEDIALYDFKHGEIDVIINVGKLTTGFDEPRVECMILARPSKSLRLYLQIIGRGLRLYENKKHCLILDVAGLISQHGYPTMIRDFNKVKPPPRETSIELLETKCPSCGYETQIKNCLREVIEKRNFTTTTWYCPNCDEIIRETVIDNREVKKMKLIKDYTNISKVSNKDVEELVKKVQHHKGYKLAWLVYVAKDYKKYKSFKDSLKLTVNKYNAGMINLDTVLRHIVKNRKSL